MHVAVDCENELLQGIFKLKFQNVSCQAVQFWKGLSVLTQPADRVLERLICIEDFHIGLPLQ